MGLVAMSDSPNYRPEIDGLRAVAVAAVIANHYFPRLLPGGYLGVDIFFVISGYVITSSLTADKSASNLTAFLGTFYARRIKRLLPALVACVIATAAVGALFISPRTDAFRSSMRAGLYSLIGLSNMDFFNHSTDYFASAAGLNLFTHTWSLGVEEQFYIIFPTLFWFASRTASNDRNRLSTLLVGLAIASWAVNAYLLRARVPGAYFLMPTRFWELALGSLTLLIGQQPAVLSRLTSTAVSMAALVCGVIALGLGLEREVAATSLVTLSTAALLFVLQPQSLGYRFLTLQPVIAIGLMSYSLYLWHWSVLVIGRWTIGTTGTFAFIEILTVAALSTLTYLFIESPLRRARWATSNRLIVLKGIGAIAVSAVALQLIISPLGRRIYTGKPATLMYVGAASLLEDRLSNQRVIWPARECVLTSNREVAKSISWDRCTFGPRNASAQVLVVGNSFSAAEFEMYSPFALKGYGSVTVTSSWDASPVPGMRNYSPWSKANQHYWNNIFPKLTESLRPGDVLVFINDLADLLPGDGHARVVQEDLLGPLEASLSAIADAMGRRGIAVLFQTSNPFLRDAHCSPDMAMRQWFNVGEPQLCTFYTREQTLARRAPLDDVLRQVSEQHPNFTVLDLMPIMCPDKVCGMTNREGAFLYRDEWSHPSVEANMLAQNVFLGAIELARSRLVAAH